MSSKLHCPLEFIKFQEVQSNFRSNISDGISYEAFNSNCFFASFDLKTTALPTDPNVSLPTVLDADQMRITVLLSDALPQETTMLFIACYNNAMQLDCDNSVKLSYANRIN
jgi:hypothetical protein